MSDSPASNVAEFSVSEISGAIKRTMEDAFGRVRVRGELGRVSRPASGHIYLDLKDDKAVLNAVIWKGAAAKMSVRPEEGLEVIAVGRITTFPGQSKYQMVIDEMEPAGAGALMALLEERKRKLAAEGLFAPERKRPLPFMPKVIGVVTSPTGAVIRDILHRLNDRFPLHVVVWPVRVQGESCASEVAAAINGFNTLDGTEMVPKPDVIIVARGGGSMEDLWGFNEEIVARAAAASHIPLISAVGHETDTTLIDYVADRRAPTPTAAAEMAVPVKAELEAQVAQLGARLSAAITRATDRKRDTIRALSRGLPQPDTILALPRQRLDGAHVRFSGSLRAYIGAKRGDLQQRASGLTPRRLEARLRESALSFSQQSNRLPKALDHRIIRDRTRLEAVSARLSTRPIQLRAQDRRSALLRMTRELDRAAAQRLERLAVRGQEMQRLLKSFSHESVLERGFAIVRDANGEMVRQSASVKSGDALTILFGGGDTLGAIAAGADAISAPAKPARKKSSPDDQGDLF